MLNELLRRQNEREAAEQEEIRKAVADSDVPIPDELLQRVLPIFDTEAREILRGHKGYSLAERRDSYLASHAILERSLDDLIAAINAFSDAALEEKSTIFNRNRRDDLKGIEARVQKEMFATANAAHSIVDHCRRLTSEIPIPGYEAQLKACFGEDGLHELVLGLRRLLHHIRFIEAGWSIHTNARNEKSATFRLPKPTVLRIIEAHGTAAQKRALLAYLGASESIDVKAFFIEYRRRLTAFHQWLQEKLKSEAPVALQDYERCRREKKNFSTRLSWKAFIGNWLNWEKPPNPHDHLSKYLTPEQMAAVYALPRNSQEQVDLVISYVDHDNAIDDDLRKMAYRLFERSVSTT
jgi:hypothetical protein